MAVIAIFSGSFNDAHAVAPLIFIAPSPKLWRRLYLRMKSAKYMLGVITLLLFIIAIYLKVSGKTTEGTTRISRVGWKHLVWDGNVVMFFALVMAIAFYYVIKYKDR